MKKISKKTKTLLIVAGGLLVLAFGVGIWGYLTERLKIGAAVTPGFISGQISRDSKCSVPLVGGAPINQWLITLRTGSSGPIVGSTKTDTAGKFYFGQLVSGQTYTLESQTVSCYYASYGSCQGKQSAVAKDAGTWVTLNVKPLSGKYHITVQGKDAYGNLNPLSSANIQWPDNIKSPTNYAGEAVRLVKVSPWSGFTTITKQYWGNQQIATTFKGCQYTDLGTVNLIWSGY